MNVEQRRVDIKADFIAEFGREPAQWYVDDTVAFESYLEAEAKHRLEYARCKRCGLDLLWCPNTDTATEILNQVECRSSWRDRLLGWLKETLNAGN